MHRPDACRCSCSGEWSDRCGFINSESRVQASEASRAAQTSREQVVELQLAAQAKDKENAKLWEQVRPAMPCYDLGFGDWG